MPWAGSPIRRREPPSSGAITREELRAKLERGEPVAPLEVLPVGYGRRHHLPTACSLPPAEVTTRVPQLVPDRDTEIVVHCSDDG